LRRVKTLDARAVCTTNDPDLQKLFVTHRLLQLRRALPDAFGARAGYRTLTVAGRHAQHAVAFVRGEQVVVVVPRLVLRCGGDFGDARIALPQGNWEHCLTGERHAGVVGLAALFSTFPIAVLRAASDQSTAAR
jgi:(1->4)-alpha-D-glucan 1-alpha-D-glucosylmutase